jgi:hypothetical protein
VTVARHATVTDHNVQAKVAALAAPVATARKDRATVLKDLATATIAVAMAARHATATVDRLAPKTAVVAEVLAKRATAQPGNNLWLAQSVTTPRKAH